MSGFRKIVTSAEVYAVLRAKHGSDMAVYSSFSDPDGTSFGGDGRVGRIETEWAMRDGTVPILAAKTTWEIDPSTPYKRINEKHEYWLCYPIDWEQQ